MLGDAKIHDPSMDVEPGSPEEARELRLTQLMGSSSPSDEFIPGGLPRGFHLTDGGAHTVVATGATYQAHQRERFSNVLAGIEPDFDNPDAYASCEPRFLF